MATACKTYHIPLIVVADTLKFSDAVQLDSIAMNELNDPRSFRPMLLPSLNSTEIQEKWALEGYESIEKWGQGRGRM